MKFEFVQLEDFDSCLSCSSNCADLASSFSLASNRRLFDSDMTQRAVVDSPSRRTKALASTMHRLQSRYCRA